MFKIFDLLKESHTNQSEFAKAIGVSTGNVTDWKNGRSAPKADTLIKIADYFNVSVDYLLGRTVSRQSAAPPGISAEALLIAAAFDRATPKEQDTVRVVLSEYIASPTTQSANKAV